MKIEVTNQNYCCTIVEIPENLHAHSNADRLDCVGILGNNLIIGKGSMKPKDLAIYFPLESQLSVEFATKNDLIKRTEIDDEGNVKAKGYFENHRRVKCLKLCGEKSEGFLCSIDYLSYLGENIVNQLKIGDEFNIIDNHEICTKYMLPVDYAKVRSERKNQGRKAKETSRLIEGQFAFHHDTSKLAKNSHRIKPESLISVTLKMHGTSAVISNCQVKRKLKWYEKFLQKLGVQIDDKEYDLIYSSRRVVQNDKSENYYSKDPSDNIYRDVANEFKGLLHFGETVYLEILGFTKGGKAIQKGFDYSKNLGEHDVYVYRMTKTGVDGKVHEYSYHQLAERCKNIGFKAVPLLYYGQAMANNSGYFDGGRYWDFGSSFDEMQTTTNKERLLLGQSVLNKEEFDKEFGEYFAKNCKKFVDKLGYSKYCKPESKVYEEGIVVCLEELDRTPFKCKNFEFLGLETKNLDAGEVDIESEQDSLKEDSE